MSIKSFKSLPDDLYEIWEKSYSVKSVSDECSSCEDEAEALSRRLLAALTPARLSQLRRAFRKKPSRLRGALTSKVEQVLSASAAKEGIEFARRPPPPPEHNLLVSQEDFVAAVEGVFGNHKYTTHAQKLFQVLDPFCTKQISWSDLLDLLVEHGARKTRTRADQWSPITEEQLTTITLEHCKRETIVRLVGIGSTESFCYAAVSRGGRVGLYGGDLRPLCQYEMWYHRTGETHKVKNSWVTDAVFMSDVQCLVISASDRSLSIYEASTLNHTPLYFITGIPNIPTCLCYESSRHKTDTSELVFGDQLGFVTRMLFLQPRVQLLHKVVADRVNTYFWMELSTQPHSVYVRTRSRRAHSRGVARVTSRRGRVVSGGRGAPALRGEGWTIDVPRGVTCFHLLHSLNILAAGCPDGLVQLYEPPRPTPYAVLKVKAPVLDVHLVEHLQLLLACCQTTVEIWDFFEECLLQTIKIKYPFQGVMGKKFEFGSHCIHPGPRSRAAETPSPRAAPHPPSRRPSAVRAAGGGLLLQQPDDCEDYEEEQQPPPPSCVLITCCDCAVLVRLGAAGPTLLLPPPRGTRRARLPAWGGGERALAPLESESPSESSPRPTQWLKSEQIRQPQDDNWIGQLQLEAACTIPPDRDLEQMLADAGLGGILEKDFVLMLGLKSDLNKKLAELKDDMEKMAGPVGSGAPYLALRLWPPAPLAPPDELSARYRHVTRLFPPDSPLASSGSGLGSRDSRRSSDRVGRRKSLGRGTPDADTDNVLVR